MNAAGSASACLTVPGSKAIIPFSGRKKARTGVPRTEQASDGARLHPAISHRDRISDVPD
jgi:hypothetical protein